MNCLLRGMDLPAVSNQILFYSFSFFKAAIYCLLLLLIKDNHDDGILLFISLYLASCMNGNGGRWSATNVVWFYLQPHWTRIWRLNTVFFGRRCWIGMGSRRYTLRMPVRVEVFSAQRQAGCQDATDSFHLEWGLCRHFRDHHLRDYVDVEGSGVFLMCQLCNMQTDPRRTAKHKRSQWFCWEGKERIVQTNVAIANQPALNVGFIALDFQVWTLV